MEHLKFTFKEWINEAISGANTDRAAKLIQKYLERKMKTKLIRYPGVEIFKNSKSKGFGVKFFMKDGGAIRFNWTRATFSSNDLDSVDVWEKTGSTKGPSWHLSFDKNASLVTLLPFLVDVLTAPNIQAGQFEAIPPDNLRESTQLLTEGYQDIFDGVIGYLQPDSVLQVTKIERVFGSRGYKVIMHIRDNFPSLFDKQGNRVKFVGSNSDIAALEKQRAQIINAVGGTKVTVEKGATNETYAVKKEYEAMDKDLPRLAYEDQLDDLQALCRLVVKGASNALFVAGRGGTGKTQNVEGTLKKMGLDDGAGYFKNTGSASPAGIYRLLFEHNDDIILFDDSDGALKEQDGRNLFKAATDTKPSRKLVWNKQSANLMDPDIMTEDDLEDGKLPRYFDFTGKIIFISNLSIDKLDPDGALRTRALMIQIDPTDKEMINFMRKIADNINLEDGLTMSSKDRSEVVDLIEKQGKDMNLRKLVRGLNIRAGAQAAGADATWERLISRYA